MPEFNTMTDALARTVDHAEANAHQAFDKAADAARPAIDQLVAGVSAAVDRLAEAASSAANRLEATGDTLKEAPAKLTRSCRIYVREKPMTSIGLAVAAGFLLSWALRQR